MQHESQALTRKNMFRFGFTAALVGVAVGIGLLSQQLGHAAPSSLTPDAAMVFKKKDKVLVSVSLANYRKKWLLSTGTLKGTLRAELIGPDGKTVAEASKEIRQPSKYDSYLFELPAPDMPAEKIRLRCAFGKNSFISPLDRLLLIKSHETSLSADQEFAANSPGSLRCSVHAVKSMTASLPLAGAEVNIQLRGGDGKTVDLYSGKTDGDGNANANFRVPDLTDGQYTLEIATKSVLGEEKLSRAVRIKSGTKILLVTDKPLYQPGQVIHIRALALRPSDLRPAAAADIVLEVEDPKGNKVFKRTRKTSEFGIASIDFQLADEVNMGAYQVRATVGKQQAEKTVTVKRYVLPKSKIVLKADKRFYLPKETINAEIQTDYFFGKPVTNAQVNVTASTFDVRFREFQKWEGKTDDNGHAKFEIQLPGYFVGQPLKKGDAFVKLDVKVTDTADHTESISRNYTVSNQPIRVSLIPESGRLVPDMDNVVYAAAIYPDGSPAVCDVSFWHGNQAKGKPLAAVQTNAAGLSELRVTPKPDQFRQAEWEQRQIEMIGGKRPRIGGRKWVFDIYAEAKDKTGHRASAQAHIASEPMGENVLLRLDKAIYRGGETLNVDIRTSAGLPTAYLDIIRAGQTLLSRWLDVKDGKAQQELMLPQDVFGTLEVHAYQPLHTGEIIRDSRVIYVSPEGDIKIHVAADKDVHRPGEQGRIRFKVTDSKGKPAPAALGVIIVDESVYALQEMQPGLEKVYFTLQKELMKPQGQIIYRPRESIESLVREPELAAPKQQIAQVLLASAEPKAPSRWQVAPAFARREKVQAQLQRIGWSIFSYASSFRPVIEYNADAAKWRFRGKLLEEMSKAGHLHGSQLKDPFGHAWDLDSLGRIEKNFTPGNLARAVTTQRMQNVFWQFPRYARRNQPKYQKDGRWSFPDNVLDEAATTRHLNKQMLSDAWGEKIRLVKVDERHKVRSRYTEFDFHELVSAGPDRTFGTDDDLRLWNANAGNVTWWWMPIMKGHLFGAVHGGLARRGALMPARQLQLAEAKTAEMMPEVLEVAAAAMPADDFDGGDKPTSGSQPTRKSGGAKPVRVRKYFPETMLWAPSLITNDRGIAELPITYADSITTWRLSASASTRNGLLGGVTSPLRVFQDFFIDLDLPVNLTQYDEVAFPVAVYNYLKEPQTVRLELQKQSWFELMDEGGYTRSLPVKPSEVTSVKFRIRALRIGNHPLTVKAYGSKMSDAIRRVIEVAPDGKKIEKVVTDRLAGNVAQTINIPEHAVADASKILVKVYPGVFSQVMEGMEGMLRLPGG